MPRQLPPLNALRAFEAAARHLSFSKAADELNVTKAAISHQIRGLEDYLGFSLFERHNRSIALTEAAEQSLGKLREGFNCLSEAVHLMRSHVDVETVSIWTAPSFASKWLIPRLHRFSSQFPEIDLKVMSDVKLLGASSGMDAIDRLSRGHDVDVVIRFGSGNYPGYRVDRLLDVEAVPLCSPALVEQGEHPLRRPADLRFHTLLHDDTDYRGRPSWANWLAHYGVKGVNHKRGLHFNHVLMAMGAAIDGQGVLLSMERLARKDIAEKRLCIPFDLRLPLEHAYHVIRTESSGRRRAVKHFIDWLLEEAAGEDLQAAG
ncbi:MAG: transcriptional regulator GcvA [Gammaproteobacteria bacterium]|nr:transcriptional regulator GcvA [Gammaproteobacteria bacterium]